MRIKDTKCKTCGGSPEIHGSDSGWGNTEGPWLVACFKCGRETIRWALQREAWAQWKIDNKTV